MGPVLKAIRALAQLIRRTPRKPPSRGTGAAKKAGQQFPRQKPCASPACQAHTPRQIRIPDVQLQKKFKHAKGLGIQGNWNPQNAQKFRAALERHVASPSTVRIEGVFTRGPQQVIHYVDPKTGVNVMTDRTGSLISAWKLQPGQLRNVLTTGKLGGK